MCFRFVCCLIQAGALTLASPEVRFTRSEETQDPIDMELYETKESNSLVEEFMLLANCSVAAKIYSAYPNFAMLRCVTLLPPLSSMDIAASCPSSSIRRHPTPPEKNFIALKKSARLLGMELYALRSLSTLTLLPAYHHLPSTSTQRHVLLEGSGRFS